jgi:hypothetical protein
LVAPEIEPGTSGSAARNSDHYTTEAVYYKLSRQSIKKFNSVLLLELLTQRRDTENKSQQGTGVKGVIVELLFSLI